MSIFKKLKETSKENPLWLSLTLTTISAFITVLNIALIVASIKGIW